MLQQLKELSSDTLTYGLGGVLTQAISFFLIPVYTIYLRPSDYGVIAMLTVLNQLFLAVASLGLRTAMYREFFASEDTEARRTAVTTAIQTASGAGLVLMLAGQLWAPALATLLTRDAANSGLVRLQLLTAVFATTGGLMMIVLQSARRVRLVASLNLLKTGILIALNVLLIVILELGLWGFVTAELLTEVVLAIFLVRAVSSFLHRRSSLRVLRKMLLYGLPFMPSRILGIGMSVFGTFMVGRMLGMQHAGLYSLASRFAQPLQLVVGAFSTAWASFKFKIRYEYERPRDFFAATANYFTALLLFLWLGIAVWGPEALRLMTPADFHGAAYLIFAVALVRVPMGLNYLLGTGLELVEDTRRVPLVSLAGLLTVVGAGLVLVPWTGPLGAAFATALAYLVLACGNLLVSRNAYAIPFRWLLLLGLVFAAFVLYGLVWTVRDCELKIRLLAALGASVAFPLVAFAMFWSTSERSRLQRLLALIWSPRQ